MNDQLKWQWVLSVIAQGAVFAGPRGRVDFHGRYQPTPKRRSKFSEFCLSDRSLNLLLRRCRNLSECS